MWGERPSERDGRPYMQLSPEHQAVAKKCKNTAQLLAAITSLGVNAWQGAAGAPPPLAAEQRAGELERCAGLAQDLAAAQGAVIKEMQAEVSVLLESQQANAREAARLRAEAAALRAAAEAQLRAAEAPPQALPAAS
jgi:hypothetical protein